MAMRQSSGQAAPYNPLEWTTARGASPQAGAAAQLGRASPQAYSDGKSVVTTQESYIAARGFSMFCIFFGSTSDGVGPL
jgi:hypothetical protein